MRRMLKKFWDWLYWGKGASPYASFERRLMASMVDTLLLTIAVAPLFKKFLTISIPAKQTLESYLAAYQAGHMTEEAFNEQVTQYLVADGGAYLLFADIGYQMLFVGIIVIIFWFCKNATPGKMLLNMEIVDARTGNKPSLFQWVLRYVGYLIAVLPMMLGFLWILWDKKRQGWHDKIAGTVVILKSQKEKP
jgi:uncharacterized RDD family membrane protein YckC